MSGVKVSGVRKLPAMPQMCVRCGLKRATYGLPGEGMKQQWCADCAVLGAVNLQQQNMCEGCGEKRAVYGLPDEGRKQWCAGCAAADGRGAVYLGKPKMCEGCDLDSTLHS